MQGKYKAVKEEKAEEHAIAESVRKLRNQQSATAVGASQTKERDKTPI